MEYSGRAWRVVRFGEPLDAVDLQDLTWKEPEPGHVLIRVRAAGAGYPDLWMASGGYPLSVEPPFGLGEEAAGEVVAVPPGSRFSVGDQVTGVADIFQGWGGFADYAYLLEVQTIKIPAGLTDAQAAGFPVGFRTAHAGLVERASLAAGQTLLVLGAAGSTGSAAVQLGKALGARVIAVVGSREKEEFCARNGADHVLNHRTDDLTAQIAGLTEGRGVDLIFDTVGGDTAALVLKSLARGGSILMVGIASGSVAPLNPMELIMSNHSAVGVLSIAQEDPATEAAIWDYLAGLLERRAITPSVGSVHDFADVPQMIAKQANPAPGKAVVRITT
jgi:NADPH:quinone reductase